MCSPSLQYCQTREKAMTLIRPESVCSIARRQASFLVHPQVKALLFTHSGTMPHLPAFFYLSLSFCFSLHFPLLYSFSYFQISPKSPLAPLNRRLHNYLPPLSKLSVKNLCSNYSSQGVLLGWQCYAKVMRSPCNAGHTATQTKVHRENQQHYVYNCYSTHLQLQTWQDTLVLQCE